MSTARVYVALGASSIRTRPDRNATSVGTINGGALFTGVPNQWASDQPTVWANLGPDRYVNLRYNGFVNALQTTSNTLTRRAQRESGIRFGPGTSFTQVGTLRAHDVRTTTRHVQSLNRTGAGGDPQGPRRWVMLNPREWVLNSAFLP